MSTTLTNVQHEAIARFLFELQPSGWANAHFAIPEEDGKPGYVYALVTFESAGEWGEALDANLDSYLNLIDEVGRDADVDLTSSFFVGGFIARVTHLNDEAVQHEYLRWQTETPGVAARWAVKNFRDAERGANLGGWLGTLSDLDRLPFSKRDEVDSVIKDVLGLIGEDDLESIERVADLAYDTVANLGFDPEQPGTDEVLNFFQVLAYRFPTIAERVFSDVTSVVIRESGE